MVGSDGEVLFVPGAQEAKPTETFEDPITEGLINARPDLIPRVDGQWNKPFWNAKLRFRNITTCSTGNIPLFGKLWDNFCVIDSL